MLHKNTLRSSGFTLVEVLVAVLVLAIGLLGMAGLQVTGLRNNHTAYLRSQAAVLAYEMGDRMRANKLAVDANNYAAVTGNETAPAFNCTSTFPTSTPSCLLPAEMAQVDIDQWLTASRQTLPSARATITCTDNADTGFTDVNNDEINDANTDGDACTNNSVHIIAVSWDDNRDGNNANDPVFRIRIRP